MHIGMMVTLEIGLFSWIMIVWWLAMLPPLVWDRVERWAKRVKGRKVKPDGGPDPVLTICSRREAKATVGIVAVYCMWWLASVNPAFGMPRLVPGAGRLACPGQRRVMFC